MNLLAFGDGDVLLFMFEFFMFVIWFWILITIFGDLFRDHELSGGMKTLWVIFVIFVPLIGILVYLLVRGQGMAERAQKQALEAHKQYAAQYGGSTASAADQIAQAKSLLDSGAIDQAEYDEAQGGGAQQLTARERRHEA